MPKLPDTTDLPEAGWQRRRRERTRLIEKWMDNDVAEAVLKMMEEARDGTTNFSVAVKPPKGIPFDTKSDRDNFIHSASQYLAPKGYGATLNYPCTDRADAEVTILIKWRLTPAKRK